MPVVLAVAALEVTDRFPSGVTAGASRAVVYDPRLTPPTVEETMASFAFVLPVLPGKEDVDRETLQRFATGEDHDAFAASQRSHGITRHAVWHQETPNGTLAIVLIEADDIERALAGSAASKEPFDQRFREFVREVHGVDLENDPPPQVRPVIDSRF